MWVHLLAVVTWIGGQLFLVFVFRPALRELPSGTQPQDLLRRVGRRFRTVTWVSLITLIITGAFNMLNEGGTARIESAWGGVLMLKLLLVAVVVGLALIHDFILDPYAPTTSPRAAGAPRARYAPAVETAIVLLGLAILLIAAYLARM
jgi:putative copper export protein